MRKTYFTLIAFLLMAIHAVQLKAEKIIHVSPDGVNDVLVIKQAIETAKTYIGEPVIIKLGGGTYNLKRNQATVVKYFISNTLSWGATVDNLKYIGVYLKSTSNITLDGEGAKLITHGEMTSIVIDESENVTLKNFSIDAADPSVTEMTVESITDTEIIYKAHSTSTYQVLGTILKWVGEYGWSINSNGPVQLYDPEQDITWRTGSPTDNVTSITDLGDKRIRIKYSTIPSVKVGYTYQMRDGVRDQVAGFIHKSKNIAYDHVNLYFLGNFGIVGQYSENLSFLNCRFAPDKNSGRTNAGFADFLQVSGCKGLLKVEDTYFSGAHDDPINVHGTYLKIQNYITPTKVKVKFMHEQSWGFDAFFVGDSIDFVDVASMMSIQSAKITAVQRNDDQNITLTFDKEIDVTAYKAKSAGVVIENITWTPEVEIRRNYFSRVPTRGVLLSTRRRSVIEENTFFRMQMAGIYVSGDAASWYESGKVCNLTIRNNTFIECGSPVIFFEPTNAVSNGFVHSNILIENNTFTINSGIAVGGKSVDNLQFINNTIIQSGSTPIDNYVSLSNSDRVTKSGNKKMQPGRISITELNTDASSSRATNDKSLANDENNTTSWKPTVEDLEKWWSVDLGKTYCLNRIQLVFPQTYLWKYVIEVSSDKLNWQKVIDQSVNTISATSHFNTGDLGRNIRYLRITFNSASAGLSEVNLFGGDVLPFKKNLLNGTVIGTNGSWNNDTGATKDAVFDYNTGTFFDAPSGTAWTGLDLGKDADYKIDSIRFAPRSGNERRMINGTFEISNRSTFLTKTVLYTILSTPTAGYTLVPINNSATGRYVRYLGPSEGYGNISEVEFYGSPIPTEQASVSLKNTPPIVDIDRKRECINISFSKTESSDYLISLFSLPGILVTQFRTSNNVAVIHCDKLPCGNYIMQISNSKTQYSVKISL